MGQAGKDPMATLSFPGIGEPAWGLNTQLSRETVGRISLGCWTSFPRFLLSSCIQAIHSPGLGRQCTPTAPSAGYQDGNANLNVTGFPAGEPQVQPQVLGTPGMRQPLRRCISALWKV